MCMIFGRKLAAIDQKLNFTKIYMKKDIFDKILFLRIGKVPKKWEKCQC